MPKISNVHYGTVKQEGGDPMADYKLVDSPDLDRDDDEPLKKSDPALVDALGFDPNELDWTED